ncbi:hypothetical protein EVG20_g7333 [Dentipellis fragilis]|uniref:Peptidase A1 domain-containing protein n=1 Tax=Dentipellis fragilis TaxID=205917 RepID=A0A4Y9YIB9_9AGAM|nr:hypothetical protein EVG20_g7333 [Dentipellis fragilis]
MLNIGNNRVHFVWSSTPAPQTFGCTHRVARPWYAFMPAIHARDIPTESCVFQGSKNGLRVTTDALVSQGDDDELEETVSYANGVTITVDAVAQSVNFGGVFVNVPLGAASEVSASVTTNPMEGILGFGLSNSRRLSIPPIIDVLASTHVIPQRVTGWRLARNSAASRAQGGEITLGGVNTGSFVDGTMRIVRNIGRARKSSKCPIPTQAEYTPTSLAQMRYRHPPPTDPSQRPQPPRWVVPCNNQVELSLFIGGVFWGIDPRDIVGPFVSMVPSQFGPIAYCFSNIQEDPSRQNEWLVGSTFLKNVYLRLDYTANTIGIAQLT